MTSELPLWLDRAAYPFESRFFAQPEGRMHYVDEGQGPPVVFVHGNPSWSFEYREVLRLLSPQYRCLAPDHLGFGLSDKPPGIDYTPQAHAARLARWLDSLDLQHATLVVGDWGGPIGLSWALDHPDRVDHLVITNTWLWSVASDWYYQAFSGFVGGPLGRGLIRSRNFFADTVVKMCFGDRSKLTPELHAHYLQPLEIPAEREANWTFPGQIIGASSWLEAQWQRRAVWSAKAVSLVWGMKDIAFREKELRRWNEAFPSAKVWRLAGVGHFVAEEAPEELAQAIRRA